MPAALERDGQRREREPFDPSIVRGLRELDRRLQRLRATSWRPV